MESDIRSFLACLVPNQSRTKREDSSTTEYQSDANSPYPCEANSLHLNSYNYIYCSSDKFLLIMADVDGMSSSYEGLRRAAIESQLAKISDLITERNARLKQLYMLETMVDRPEDTNLDTLLTADLYEEDPAYVDYRRQNGVQLASNDLPAEVTHVAQIKGVVLIPSKASKPPIASRIIPKNSLKSTIQQPPIASSELPRIPQQNKLQGLQKESPTPSTLNGDAMDVDSPARRTSATPAPNGDTKRKAATALKNSALINNISTKGLNGHLTDQFDGLTSSMPKHKKLKIPLSKVKKDVPEEIRGYQLAAWKSLVYKKPVSIFLQTASKSLSTKDWQIAREEQKQFKLLARIEALEKEGCWSFKQRLPHQPPPRPKSHHDVMLDEMRWMSQDFRQERKWKIAMCFKVARDVMEWHNAEDKSTVCVDRDQVERSAHALMDLDFFTPHSTIRSVPETRREPQREPANNNTDGVVDTSSTGAPEALDAAIVSMPGIDGERTWKGRDAEIRLSTDPSALQSTSVTIQRRLSRPPEVIQVDSESLVYIVPATSSESVMSPMVRPSLALDASASSSSTSVIPASQSAPSSVPQPLPPTQQQPSAVLDSSQLQQQTLVNKTMSSSTPPLPVANITTFTMQQPVSLLPLQSQPSPQTKLHTPDILYSTFDAANLFYDPMPYHKIIPVTSLMNTRFVVKDRHRYDQYGFLKADDIFDDEEHIPLLPGNEKYHQTYLTSPLFGGKKLKEDKGFEPQPSPYQIDQNRAVAPWTTEEEDMLLVLVAQFPSNWDLVADNLASARLGPPHALRTPYDCFIRWGRAIKEQKANALAAGNEAAAGPSSVPQTPLSDVPLSPLSPVNPMMSRKQKLESQHMKLLRRDEQRRIKRHYSVYDLIRQYAEQREACKPSPTRPPKQINLAAHETHQQSQVQAGVSLDNPPLTPLQLGQLKERRDKEIRSLHEASRMMARPPIGAPLGYGPAYPNYRLARPVGATPSSANGAPLCPPGQPTSTLPAVVAAQVAATGALPNASTVTPLPTTIAAPVPPGAPRVSQQMSQGDLNRILMARQQQLMQRPMLAMTPQQRQEQAALIAALPPAQRQLLLNNQMMAVAQAAQAQAQTGNLPPNRPANPANLAFLQQALAASAAGRSHGNAGVPGAPTNNFQLTPELLQQLNLQRALLQQQQAAALLANAQNQGGSQNNQGGVTPGTPGSMSPPTGVANSSNDGSMVSPPGVGTPVNTTSASAPAAAACNNSNDARGALPSAGTATSLPTNIAASGERRLSQQMAQGDLNRILMARQQQLMQRPILAITPQQRQEQSALIATIPPAQRQMLLNNQMMAVAQAAQAQAQAGVTRPASPADLAYLQQALAASAAVRSHGNGGVPGTPTNNFQLTPELLQQLNLQRALLQQQQAAALLANAQNQALDLQTSGQNNSDGNNAATLGTPSASTGVANASHSNGVSSSRVGTPVNNTSTSAPAAAASNHSSDHDTVMEDATRRNHTRHNVKNDEEEAEQRQQPEERPHRETRASARQQQQQEHNHPGSASSTPKRKRK
ncbi:hypothetical protein SeLEV6574_g06157 [Synchytrium endobioticum]|uniref:Vacuolar import and degradation protein 21 n=1 Tax=Synchytrium endobioticum TaxID=286115 RepID=A0A507CQA0_9FUNG|nr:hypothetical protein SeLEV6574_g06157 [Synchytrium endobioticum]